MKISSSEEYWHLIAMHTHARRSLGCPWSMQQQVAAVVGEHGIAASWADYVPTGPSLWTVVAVTDDGRLIRVRMEFDTEQYDLDAEQRTHRMHQQVGAVLHEASSHRLRDAASLHIGKVFQRSDGFGKPSPGDVDVTELRLRFSDGTEVDLGVDQSRLHDADDRSRSDALFDTVRLHAGV